MIVSLVGCSDVDQMMDKKTCANNNGHKRDPPATATWAQQWIKDKKPSSERDEEPMQYLRPHVMPELAMVFPLSDAYRRLIVAPFPQGREQNLEVNRYRWFPRFHLLPILARHFVDSGGHEKGNRKCSVSGDPSDGFSTHDNNAACERPDSEISYCGGGHEPCAVGGKAAARSMARDARSNSLHRSGLGDVPCTGPPERAPGAQQRPRRTDARCELITQPWTRQQRLVRRFRSLHRGVECLRNKGS